MADKPKTIHAKLAEVQSELKAPKGQFNQFGNYAYRSCEDILSAAKPLVTKRDLHLTISDEIVEVGGRVYVKATATVSDGATEISTTAYAREEQSKKGMDASQLTGSTSSYARKYALNGLFCIDDTKDADSQDNSQHETKAEKVSESTVADIEAKMEEVGADGPKFMKWVHSQFGAGDLSELTTEQAPQVLAMLERKARAA